MSVCVCIGAYGWLMLYKIVRMVEGGCMCEGECVSEVEEVTVRGDGRKSICLANVMHVTTPVLTIV